MKNQVLILSLLLPLSVFAEEANPAQEPTGPVHPGLNPEVGSEFPGVGVEEQVAPAALPQLAYYPDGSLKYDDYGEIVNIEYNALKLPSKVDRGLRVLPEGMAVAPQMDEIQSVLYGYSADGFKLRREERNANPDMTAYPVGHFTTDYVGNCIWRGETLSAVLTEGGYIDASDGSYHFFVTDHLGNVRAITDGSGTIEKSFDYYPFGESYASETVSNPGEAFRYGGKEREEKFGIHEVYDFSARWYSPVYGRFQTMDPLCEKYYSLSPYAYCANNPMNLVDPTGSLIDDFVFDYSGFFIGVERTNEEDRIVVRDENGDNSKYIKFADKENDPKQITRDTKLVFITGQSVEEMLSKSGVMSKKHDSIFQRIKYLKEESNSQFLSGHGYLDFVGSGYYGINPEINQLYVTESRGIGFVAHNAYNYGNYLWGAASHELKIPFWLASLGAHINNYFWDPVHKGTLDSPDDQFSIKSGYQWVR